MMLMPLSEILDRYTIAKLKSERANEDVSDELIKYIRPHSYEAKPTTQYYPRPGSSAGKIETRIVGAQRVNRDFAKFIKAIFSIGDGMAKFPNVKVTRTFK